jgi:hypothetical protein
VMVKIFGELGQEHPLAGGVTRDDAPPRRPLLSYGLMFWFSRKRLPGS